ncbi:MAG: hypothetical protein H6895_10560 [Defluviimonas sp.]|uniref:arsenate reductase family protein n=1 Tax=Albidovulum sp. TaxID=1872424 RepID=UPI001E0BA8C5|nr:hypothetical protein [Paracoccaceae bacterium]MCC0064513.1 hypothetical protein [Defluviimonas sp.]
MILYGLSSCDTCRAAQKALRAGGQAVTFRDVRADPLTDAERAEFVTAFGDAIVNRSSTTWRGLGAEARTLPPEALLAAHPTLMKRPVIRAGSRLLLGWKNDVQRLLLE